MESCIKILESCEMENFCYSTEISDIAKLGFFGSNLQHNRKFVSYKILWIAHKQYQK